MWIIRAILASDLCAIKAEMPKYYFMGVVGTIFGEKCAENLHTLLYIRGPLAC